MLVSLLIAGGFVWALQQGGLPLTPPARTFTRLTWWGLPGFLVLTLCCMVLRAQRIYYLLRAIRHDISASRVLGIGLVGYGAIFFAPLRLGEVVRPYLLSQSRRVSFSGGVGVVAAERVIDGLVMVVMTSAGLALSTHVAPLPDHVGSLPIPVSLVPRALSSAACLFTLAFAGMAGLYAARSWAPGLVRKLLSVISLRLGEAVAAIMERVTGAFAFLASARSAVPFVLSTCGSWLFNAAANWVLLNGVGLHATFEVACVTVGIVALGSLLPGGPGFFGTYQIAAYTSLAMYFGPGAVVTLGAMYVFASYAGYVLLHLVTALFGFYLLAKSRESTTIPAI